mgnify:CR=1 FL=1
MKTKILEKKVRKEINLRKSTDTLLQIQGILQQVTFPEIISSLKKLSIWQLINLHHVLNPSQ